jgi:hypothetical protein
VKINDMWWAPFLQLPMWLMFALRDYWRPRFPRAWRGRRVTVCYDGRTWMQKMERIHRDHFEMWIFSYEVSIPPNAFYFRDEGITWCTGWSGKQVDALRVAAALAVLES